MSRLYNKKGFSMAEMLVAVLIVAMVVALIAGGGKVAKNAYQRITVTAEAATLMSTTITKVTDELRYASSVETMNIGTSDSAINNAITFQSGNFGYRICLNSPTNLVEFGGGESATKEPIQVVPVGQIDSTFSLLTEATMTDGLVPVIEDVNYDYSKNIFSATIRIYQYQLGQEPLEVQTISVRPINPRA